MKAPGVLDIRALFPILSRKVNGKRLVYLDNAATTQKPESVLNAMDHYYRSINSNVHRGIHTLSREATDAYEAAREKIARLVNAQANEIVFTRGTTESINLVASSWGRLKLRKGDSVLISHMEHHSNIVPWQMACSASGARLKVIPVTDEGALDMESYGGMMDPTVKMVAVTHVSNTLGTVNPVEEITAIAKKHGAAVLLDGAQAVPHLKVDVKKIGCDFYAFSGHKLYGPTGIGALYGTMLEEMPPYQGGGEMILSVSFEKTTYNNPPAKFEAGTPDIAGAIGMGAAADFISATGYPFLQEREEQLLEYATETLARVDGLRIIGTARPKAAVISFVFKDIHPHDIGTILDSEGVAVRTGHHCTQPLMERFGVPATTRASFAVYNTKEETDILAEAVVKVKKIFG